MFWEPQALLVLPHRQVYVPMYKRRGISRAHIIIHDRIIMQFTMAASTNPMYGVTSQALLLRSNPTGIAFQVGSACKEKLRCQSNTQMRRFPLLYGDLVTPRFTDRTPSILGQTGSFPLTYTVTPEILALLQLLSRPHDNSAPRLLLLPP